MKTRYTISLGTALAVITVWAPLHAGEFDPSQQNWVDHYSKQPNVPEPEAMLLNQEAEPDLKEGFVPLFNGKDLTGWTPHGGRSTFEVKDGCIVGTCLADSPSTYLCTERADYGDFIFTTEMKWEVEINSGVMFRARFKDPDRKTVMGPQAEMEPFSQDREWSGGIYGQSCGGWFYPLWLEEHAAARQAQKKEGWNRLTIKADGMVVKTWLNGVPVAHWVNDTYLQGFFGLQVHKAAKGQVLWRNMKIREL